MGWTRIAKLETTTLDPAITGPTAIWTRGGIEGVEVHHECTCIHIPRSVILELIADEYTSAMIRKYESMEVDAILDEMELPR